MVFSAVVLFTVTHTQRVDSVKDMHVTRIASRDFAIEGVQKAACACSYTTDI
jgi:hypothetical protein